MTVNKFKKGDFVRHVSCIGHVDDNSIGIVDEVYNGECFVNWVNIGAQEKIGKVSYNHTNLIKANPDKKERDLLVKCGYLKEKDETTEIYAFYDDKFPVYTSTPNEMAERVTPQDLNALVDQLRAAKDQEKYIRDALGIPTNWPLKVAIGVIAELLKEINDENS